MIRHWLGDECADGQFSMRRTACMVWAILQCLKWQIRPAECRGPGHPRVAVEMRAVGFITTVSVHGGAPLRRPIYYLYSSAAGIGARHCKNASSLDWKPGEVDSIRGETNSDRNGASKDLVKASPIWGETDANREDLNRNRGKANRKSMKQHHTGWLIGFLSAVIATPVSDYDCMSKHHMAWFNHIVFGCGAHIKLRRQLRDISGVTIVHSLVRNLDSIGLFCWLIGQSLKSRTGRFPIGTNWAVTMAKWLAEDNMQHL